MQITNLDIIQAIEQAAPRRLQESYDNTGLQCGNPQAACTGVILCVDVTPAIIAETIERGCNLVISHHPLLFRAIKSIDARGRVQQSLVAAIKNDITVYSCHTAVDNAPGGISHVMARMLGLTDVTTLEERPADATLGTVGCGVTGTLPLPLTPLEFVELVKTTFGSPVARCSDPEALTPGRLISRIALCGGAGAFLLDRATAIGADAFVTSDTKFNCFLDYADSLLLVDIGHFESENCSKEIFYHAITKKFPNFAVYYSQVEQNPIKYL
ncbi:MAG: Nif3-like dinuclear metal center hexameric protein [Muribaculaceae bacterium]|nr:Nif3-like dinuclear metal center hexameric protein [Muribaculaceae bacterium]